MGRRKVPESGTTPTDAEPSRHRAYDNPMNELDLVWGTTLAAEEAEPPAAQSTRSGRERETRTRGKRAGGSRRPRQDPMERIQAPVMQRLSERLSEAGMAEERLAVEQLGRELQLTFTYRNLPLIHDAASLAGLRALEAARDAEAKLTGAELEVARASERARRAEWAKDQIAAQFEEHVSQAERNVSVLREELASCTAELYEALSEAKTKAAEETQRADEAERQLAEEQAASAELQAVAERVQHAEERADEGNTRGKVPSRGPLFRGAARGDRPKDHQAQPSCRPRRRIYYDIGVGRTTWLVHAPQVGM